LSIFTTFCWKIQLPGLVCNGQVLTEKSLDWAITTAPHGCYGACKECFFDGTSRGKEESTLPDCDSGSYNTKPFGNETQNLVAAEYFLSMLARLAASWSLLTETTGA
jgi:hypothetical protein